MTTYTKTTDFAAKDALSTGNPSKLVKGTEIGAEFDNLATADATSAKKDAANTFSTTTDSTSSTTGAQIISGGVGIAKNLVVGKNVVKGYTTTATAAGTTTLTVSDAFHQYFTGSTTQTVVLPVTSTLQLGWTYRITNLSSGVVTVQSSGANTVLAIQAGGVAEFVCILTSGTTAASWDVRSFAKNDAAQTFTGVQTFVAPVLGTPTSGTLTNCTGLPASGLVATTSTAVGFGSIELGHASDTTIARVSAGKISVEGVNIGTEGLVQNSQSAAYTTVLTDAGKHIHHPSTDANARTFTIDSNANVAYPLGTAITFTNLTSNNVTIAITSDTMYLASTGTTGSRTLAQYGVATAIKVETTKWIISGSGLT